MLSVPRRIVTVFNWALLLLGGQETLGLKPPARHAVLLRGGPCPTPAKDKARMVCWSWKLLAAAFLSVPGLGMERLQGNRVANERSTFGVSQAEMPAG